MSRSIKRHNLISVLVICAAVLLLTPHIGGDSTSSASVTISGHIPPSTTPDANFTANQTMGDAPLSVQFTDLSVGGPTQWEWDFESDGILDDTIPNPVHTYGLPGMYSVNLTVRNPEGSDTEIKLGYITVREPDPRLRIQELKEYIQELPTPFWTKWFLARPLERALDQLEKGHDHPAITQLNLFMGTVDLMVRAGFVSHNQAVYMIDEAEEIIALILA
jgi:PKD repeat protein